MVSRDRSTSSSRLTMVNLALPAQARTEVAWVQVPALDLTPPTRYLPMVSPHGISPRCLRTRPPPPPLLHAARRCGLPANGVANVHRDDCQVEVD